jgi:hypothetical protein
MQIAVKYSVHAFLIESAAGKERFNGLEMLEMLEDAIRDFQAALIAAGFILDAPLQVQTTFHQG